MNVELKKDEQCQTEVISQRIAQQEANLKQNLLGTKIGIAKILQGLGLHKELIEREHQARVIAELAQGASRKGARN